MASAADFLTETEKQQIVSAIETAEQQTIGEIRVHIEKWCWGDARKRANSVFLQLGMNKTAERTGVLIYIAAKSQKMAIVGDSGINAKVSPDFWKSTLEHSLSCFKEQRFAQGMIDAVTRCAVPLAEHFPKTPGNPNELSNEISFG